MFELLSIISIAGGAGFLGFTCVSISIYFLAETISRIFGIKIIKKV